MDISIFKFYNNYVKILLCYGADKIRWLNRGGTDNSPSYHMFLIVMLCIRLQLIPVIFIAIILDLVEILNFLGVYPSSPLSIYES